MYQFFHTRRGSGFLGSPSYCKKLGGADEFDDNALTIPSKKVKVDWSHSSRKKMAALKSASHPLQKRITDYHDLVEKIDLLNKTNNELMMALNKANEE